MSFLYTLSRLVYTSASSCSNRFPWANRWKREGVVSWFDWTRAQSFVCLLLLINGRVISEAPQRLCVHCCARYLDYLRLLMQSLIKNREQPNLFASLNVVLVWRRVGGEGRNDIKKLVVFVNNKIPSITFNINFTRYYSFFLFFPLCLKEKADALVWYIKPSLMDWISQKNGKMLKKRRANLQQSRWRAVQMEDTSYAFRMIGAAHTNPP